MFGYLLIKRLHLCGVQLLADLQEHVDVLLLQFGARLSDAIDSGEDLALVLGIAGGDYSKEGLLALEVGVERDESGTVGLEDAVHALLLFGAEAEFFDGFMVVPPAAAEA